MPNATHFPRMARFNAWVNNILYDAVAKLPSEAYRGDEGLFFGSVHATLNHLLLVDRLWTNRMKGAPNGFDDLAEEIHEDFESLQIARRAEDEDFIALIDELCRGDLERRVEYIAMIGGGRSAATLEQMISTLLNHQTHHRGQITAILTRHGIELPEIDLIMYLYETGEAETGLAS